MLSLRCRSAGNPPFKPPIEPRQRLHRPAFVIDHSLLDYPFQAGSMKSMAGYSYDRTPINGNQPAFQSWHGEAQETVFHFYRRQGANRGAERTAQVAAILMPRPFEGSKLGALFGGEFEALFPEWPLADKIRKSWGCSSAGRAPRSQRGGQRFDPAQLHQLS